MEEEVIGTGSDIIQVGESRPIQPSFLTRKVNLMKILKGEQEPREEPRPNYSKESDEDIITLVEEWRAIQERKKQQQNEALAQMRLNEEKKIEQRLKERYKNEVLEASNCHP